MCTSNRYTTRHVRAALDLYSEGLSCREVCERMAESFAPPIPSQEWVHAQVTAAGIRRTKSRANELREARRRRRNYDAIRPLAYQLARESNFSPRQIAEALNVSRQYGKRVCAAVARERDELVRSVTDGYAATENPVTLGMLRRKWLADLPDVKKRREMVARCAELRLEGKSYKEIRQATGVPLGTIAHYLKLTGINTGRKPRDEQGALP